MSTPISLEDLAEEIDMEEVILLEQLDELISERGSILDVFKIEDVLMTPVPAEVAEQLTEMVRAFR